MTVVELDVSAMSGPSVPESQDVPVFLALGFLAVVLSQTMYFCALSSACLARSWAWLLRQVSSDPHRASRTGPRR